MDNLRGRIELQSSAVRDLKKEMDDSKKDFVSIDKINVLKIKLGGLMEELKASERVEAKLKELEKKAADKAQVSESLEELKNQLDAVEDKATLSASAAKLDKLINEMNEEFIKVRESVRGIEEKGGSIVKDRFARLEADSGRRMTVVEKKLGLIIEEMKKKPAKQEINQLLRDVNSEFNEIRNQLDQVAILRNDLKSMRREKAGRIRVNEEFSRINSEIDSMKSQIASLKRGKAARQQGPGGRSLYFLANSLIVLAFIILGASIVLFFMGRDGLMDYFIYSSIGSFMLGILLRVFLVLKG